MEEKPMTVLLAVVLVVIVMDAYRAGGSLPGF